MTYDITPEVLAVAALMAAKAGTDETPEQYVTKRIDMLLQTWVDEIENDAVMDAARAIRAAKQ
jgi:hypothetical protein